MIVRKSKELVQCVIKLVLIYAVTYFVKENAIKSCIFKVGTCTQCILYSFQNMVQTAVNIQIKSHWETVTSRNIA